MRKVGVSHRVQVREEMADFASEKADIWIAGRERFGADANERLEKRHVGLGGLKRWGKGRRGLCGDPVRPFGPSPETAIQTVCGRIAVLAGGDLQNSLFAEPAANIELRDRRRRGIPVDNNPVRRLRPRRHEQER
jgi:hypothetical protein